MGNSADSSIIAVKELKLAKTGLHDAVTANTNFIYFEDEAGNEYKAYYCTKCGHFVVVD